ncbi:iron donor protein CyaY [bacterium]|nr:iron donor protein CyaY [bacterium]
MNEREYIELCTETLLVIETELDEMIDQSLPIDYESGEGMLTIICTDSQTPVILSRQRPLKQIWVAARSGGFHLEYTGGRWVTTQSKETLGELLSRTCSEQSDQAINLLIVDGPQALG